MLSMRTIVSYNDWAPGGYAAATNAGLGAAQAKNEIAMMMMAIFRMA